MQAESCWVSRQDLRKAMWQASFIIFNGLNEPPRPFGENRGGLNVMENMKCPSESISLPWNLGSLILGTHTLGALSQQVRSLTILKLPGHERAHRERNSRKAPAFQPPAMWGEPGHQVWEQVSFQKVIPAPILKVPHLLQNKMGHNFPMESCPICIFVSKINVVII